MVPGACWPLFTQLGTGMCCTQPSITPLSLEKDLPLQSKTDLSTMSFTEGETIFFLLGEIHLAEGVKSLNY